MSDPEEPATPVGAPATTDEAAVDPPAEATQRTPPVHPIEPSPVTQPLPPPPLGQPGGPYRVPEPPGQLAHFPAYAGIPQRNRPWPIIGPAISVFAVLLWSFVVAGQLTTSWMSGGPLPQGVAAIFVLVTTFAMWIVGIRRSRLAWPPRSGAHLVGRSVAIGLLALALFVSAIVASIAGGALLRGHDLLIAFLLVGLATFAAIGGPRWTWPARPDPTHRQRVAWSLLWLAGAILTLVAGAELAIVG